MEGRHALDDHRAIERHRPKLLRDGEGLPVERCVGANAGRSERRDRVDECAVANVLERERRLPARHSSPATRTRPTRCTRTRGPSGWRRPTCSCQHTAVHRLRSAADERLRQSRDDLVEPQPNVQAGAFEQPARDSAKLNRIRGNRHHSRSPRGLHGARSECAVSRRTAFPRPERAFRFRGRGRNSPRSPTWSPHR